MVRWRPITIAVTLRGSHQCVIFDDIGENAKIMGVEHIVSRALFEKLPAEEKHLWQCHVHEVRSGQLIAPGIPEVAEDEFMEKFGHLWNDLAYVSLLRNPCDFTCTGGRPGGAAQVVNEQLHAMARANVEWRPENPCQIQRSR
jgi:hypothetical protein